MRIIAACRLSRDTDTSTAIERQSESIERWASAFDHTIVATTVDTDVSGAVSPFDRPDLGPWFKRSHEWDAIVVAKLDRISRSTVDFGNLLKWLQDNGKSIVVLDPNIDLTSIHGEAMATVIMAFAQLERKMIAQRVADSRVKLRSNAWYSGGSITPGYRAVKFADHNELEPEPVMKAAINRMADLIIGGKSARQVADIMHTENVATAKGGRWDAGGIIKILRNPALRGYIMHDEEIVRGEDGMPVKRNEAIIDDDKWLKLQAQLDTNSRPGSGIRKNASLLTAILHCAECGERLYISRRSAGDRYRHGDRAGQTCKTTYTAKVIDQAAEHTLLGYTDELPMMRLVEIPAEDHTAELARVTESIDDVEDMYLSRDISRDRYVSMMGKLEVRKTALEALPVSEAREEWIPTGELFTDHYKALGTEGRHQLLLSFGVRVDVCKETSDVLTADPIVTSGWREAARTVKVGKSIIKTDFGKFAELRERAQMI